MSFNGFMRMRMRKPHFESKFQSDKRTDLLICLHIMFQVSFQNSMGQKSYGKFLGVRSELLLSIYKSRVPRGINYKGVLS